MQKLNPFPTQSASLEEFLFPLLLHDAYPLLELIHLGPSAPLLATLYAALAQRKFLARSMPRAREGKQGPGRTREGNPRRVVMCLADSRARIVKDSVVSRSAPVRPSICLFAASYAHALAPPQPLPPPRLRSSSLRVCPACSWIAISSALVAREMLAWRK